MSGPKTDELEVERQRERELAAARERATELVAEARLALERRLDELAAATAGLAGGEEILREALAAVGTAVGVLGRECAFDQASTVQEARRRLEGIEHRVGRVREAAERRLQPLREQAEELARRAASVEDDRAFARLLSEQETGGGLDELAGLLRQVGQDRGGARTGPADAAALPRTAAAQDRLAPVPPEEQAACLQDAVARATALIRKRGTCDGDRAQLLGHLRALNGAAAGPQTLASAHGIAAQLAVLLPAMERRAEELQRLLARIDTLEAELARRSPRLAARTVRGRTAYADPDAAAGYLASLEAAVGRLDTQDYIRTCIDEIMARHGYTVVRSVTLGRAEGGSHLVFSEEHATEGIHAFVSEAGDMMLEVVGLDAERPFEDGSAVAAGQPASVLRQDELVAAQHDFCPVYAQIADELAALGIHAAGRHHARPDVRFCKELRGLGNTDACEGTGSKAAGTGRARRRGGGAAKEMR